MATTAYPFDPSGTSSANRVLNEQQVLTAQNFRRYHYIIPAFAPFVERDFKITLKLLSGAVRNLIPGIDFYFSNKFRDASLACAVPVYGSVSFLDTDTFGIVTMSYNTIGGIWTITPQEIMRILAEETRNPRITSWEQVTDVPEKFPVVDHEWDLVDMTGGKELEVAINRVAEAILQKGGGDIGDHINNLDNPHQVTKIQVGLGNVANFSVATQQQAIDGISNSAYMTPIRTADAINAIAGALVSSHANNTNNPHSTTKAQVGLSNVQNFAVATQAQAEDGTLTTLYMTPLLVRQAIAAQSTSALTTHVNNKSNPHQVDKTQIGLANVQNYGIATQAEAIAGTASDKYMTPQRTRQLVAEFVTVELDGHAARTDNPHQTSATQVGLGNVQNFGVATIAEAQVGVVNTKYMTPMLTKQAIDILGKVLLDVHASNLDNPHEVTKAQVGLSNVLNYAVASISEATAGTATDKYMTPALVKAAISGQTGGAIDGHISNKSNPHEVTALQVGLGNVGNFGIATQLEALAGVSSTAYMTPQRTRDSVEKFAGSLVATHADNKNNPHEVTKVQVGLSSVENYPVASSVDASSGTSNAMYMTPLRVKEAIASFASPSSHASATNNPHQVTALQVGAYSRAESDAIFDTTVKRTDTWVSGQDRDSFIATVRNGKSADSSALDGVSLAALLKQTAGAGVALSYDKVNTPNPATYPYRWLEIGTVSSPDDSNMIGTTTILKNHPDAYWFLAGGHKQEATPAANAAASSPGYLIHAKNGGVPGSHSFDITRLTGTVNSDVEFGYTVDANSVMHVWLKVSYGHNGVSVTHMAELGSTVTLSSSNNVIVEPTGITYKAATGLSADLTAITNRLDALEQTINSVTVA